MKVLVTGATGVLGRRVVPMLVGAGHTVTAVARNKGDLIRGAGGIPVDLDLFDASAVRAAVGRHEAVVDLATRIPATNRMMLPWAWRENDRLRSIAASHAADAAIAADARYIRESLALLYADGGDDEIDEEHPLDPISNTLSALDAEAAADRVTSAGGHGVALRLALLYSADGVHTRELFDMARRGRSPFLGDPSAYMSHVHADDAASAVVAALDAPAGIYNVVEDRPSRRGELTEILQDIVGKELAPLPRFLSRLGPARAARRSLRISNRRFRMTTGWRPRLPSAVDGLRIVAKSMEAMASRPGAQASCRRTR